MVQMPETAVHDPKLWLDICKINKWEQFKEFWKLQDPTIKLSLIMHHSWRFKDRITQEIGEVIFVGVKSKYSTNAY